MKPGSRQRIIAALHPARMAPYLAASDGNESKALSLYNWHTELTAAVQQVLGITEVVLRNAVDAQLQVWNTHRGEGPSWLLAPPASPLRGLISDKRRDAVRRAGKAANERIPTHRRHGDEVCHDDVLAQIMFGMWKDLLPNHAPDASPTAQTNRNRLKLWNEALSLAFPHETDRNGEVTYWRVAHLHRLRNRVSHMEPLLDLDLPDLSRDAFALVRSIDPVVADWLSGISRISRVVGDRPS
jgi:hypothetical protein